MPRSRISKELTTIVGLEAVLDGAEDLMLYEYDAGLSTGTPEVIVFPETAEQVSQIARLASRLKVPLVPRGAGTSFGDEADQYPSPEEWATGAVEYILKIGPKDNGKPLNVR